MDPTCFSFKKISEKNGISIYYTNPSKGKQSLDEDEIVEFYTKAIEAIGKKKWIWIFDSENLDMRYGLTLKRALDFANVIIDKYFDHLVEVKIINPILPVKAMIKLGKPFLKEDVRKKIKVLKDRYYSVLEFL